MNAISRKQPRPAAVRRAARPGAPPDDDPLARVEQLGRRSSRFGMALGVVFALGTHGAGSARAMSTLLEMHEMVGIMREQLHEFFWANYDVDVVDDEEKEEEKPDEPEPEPEPEEELPQPEPEQEAAEEEDPYEDDEPPPAPAEAGKILTAPEDPNEPVDLTDEGFVSGEGTGPGYGYVSALGTATKPTYNRRAKVGGVEGGRGSGPVKPKPRRKKVNRARPAGLVGSRSWSCPFPPEADIEQIDRATAVIVVTVSTSGRPTSVRVLSDPGYGFGRAARQCAMGRRYRPALDRTGKPVRSTTPPINVRFRR